jgi:hypothetical protein
MRVHCHIALLSILILGCRPSTPKDDWRGFDRIAPLDTVKYPVIRSEAAVSIQLHAVWDTANGSGVYCEDTTLYSMDFVRCLRSMGLPNLLEIRDGAVHGESPEPIPFDPILSDSATHYFRDPQGRSTLELRRIDLTRIEARFSTTYQGEPDKYEGRYVLGCGFILGAESDDGEDGAFFVDEYWSGDGNISGGFNQ